MNPLSGARTPIAPAEHPMLGHAKIWRHVNAMAPNDMADSAGTMSATLPSLAALAGNPKVTRKDVIKAAADAVGGSQLPPSQAVKFISDMPDDPDKLQVWLKQMYQTHLTALVHMKAAMTPDAQAAPQGVPLQ